MNKQSNEPNEYSMLDDSIDPRERIRIESAEAATKLEYLAAKLRMMLPQKRNLEIILLTNQMVAALDKIRMESIYNVLLEEQEKEHGNQDSQS